MCSRSLEGLAFKGLAILDFHLEGCNCLGDSILVQITGLGQMDGDAAVDVSCCDVTEFFQGHTGLFIGICSSSAGDC